MADAKHESDPFLKAVEAKIAAWTAVADSYRAARAIDGPLSDGGAAVAARGTVVAKAHVHGRSSSELPVGVFRDKSIKDAIVLYLQSCNGKQTNKEIASGLQKGGIATTSKNFEPTVGTALHRLKNEGIVLRFSDGWDLASSYPDGLRSRLDRGAKKAPKKVKRNAKPRSGARSTLKALPPPGGDPISQAG